METTAETKPQEKRSRREQFIDHLMRLKREDDRGPLAELRRGAGEWPECGERTLRHVARFFPPEGPDWRTETEENAMLLVATLFALNPAESNGTANVGELLRSVASARSADDAVEKRFLRLLGAREPEELATHLRHAFELAAATKGTISIDWQELLKHLIDLLSGDEDRRQRVVRKWSASYWAKREDNDADDSAPAVATAL